MTRQVNYVLCMTNYTTYGTVCAAYAYTRMIQIFERPDRLDVMMFVSINLINQSIKHDLSHLNIKINHSNFHYKHII